MIIQLYSPPSIERRAKLCKSIIFQFPLSQIKLVLFFQLIWYVLRQLFTSVSVKVVDIYLAASWLGKYPPLLTSTSVKYFIIRCEVSRNPDLLDWNVGAALMSISYPFCSRQKYTRLCLIKKKLSRREMPGFLSAPSE